MRKLVFALALVAVAGCGGLGHTSWSCPGPAKLQQLRAERFDPYPQVLSGAETVGTRPRGYDKPVAVPSSDPWPWSGSATRSSTPRY